MCQDYSTGFQLPGALTPTDFVGTAVSARWKLSETAENSDYAQTQPSLHFQLDSVLGCALSAQESDIRRVTSSCMCVANCLKGSRTEGHRAAITLQPALRRDQLGSEAT